MNWISPTAPLPAAFGTEALNVPALSNAIAAIRKSTATCSSSEMLVTRALNAASTTPPQAIRSTDPPFKASNSGLAGRITGSAQTSIELAMNVSIAVQVNGPTLAVNGQQWLVAGLIAVQQHLHCTDVIGQVYRIGTNR